MPTVLAETNDAVASIAALPGSLKSNANGHLTRVPTNSIKPKSVKNGIKKHAITRMYMIAGPLISNATRPVSAPQIMSGPIWHTTMTAKIAPAKRKRNQIGST